MWGLRLVKVRGDSWQTDKPCFPSFGDSPFTLSRVKLGLFYILQLKILFSHALKAKQTRQTWSSVSKSDYVKCPLAQRCLRPLLCSANSSGPFTSHACIQITLRVFHIVFLLYCVYICIALKVFFLCSFSLNVFPLSSLWHHMPLLMHSFLTHFLLKSYQRLLCDMQSDVLYIVNWGKEQETQGLILDVATAA